MPILHKMLSFRWVWALIAICLLWIVLTMFSQRVGLQNITGILMSASFLAFVAMGQALTISTGRGNIDLSVAGTITLSAFVFTAVNDGSTAGFFVALLATIAVGSAVGLINGLLTTFLRIPALVATLATGYALVTASQLIQRGATHARMSDVIEDFILGRTMGLPTLFLVAIAIALLLDLAMRRTGIGWALIMVGQNARAARLVGIGVEKVTIAAFVGCSVFAAIAGALLSVRSGGAFPDIGPPYLIQSIGAVILGGTAVMGGSTTFWGTVLGSVLLLLVGTTMQVLGLKIGAQEIVQGLLIMLVLVVAENNWRRRA